MIFVVDHRNETAPPTILPYCQFNLNEITSDDPFRSDNAYAEMRAHYAVWRDRTDLRWVGFEHYSRRFRFDVAPSELMNEYEIITTKPRPHDVRPQYIGSHGHTSWEVFEAVLADVGYPWHDISMFHPGNLYVMHWVHFDAYMTLWLDVMSRLKQRIHPQRGDYQERVFGFQSERLWTLWYTDHKASMKCLELEHITDKP